MIEHHRPLRAMTPDEETAAKARALARDDANGTAQRCNVCGKPYSPFGFGLPPKIPVWACRDHRDSLRP